MEFKSARCPNCSGQLSLDPSKEKGFCMHCGSEIVVKDAIKKVQIDQSPLVDNYLKLAKDAYDRGDTKEAYDYYSSVLEIDSNQWEALYYRGLSAAWQSTLANIRLSDAVQGSQKALSILSEKVINATPENKEFESFMLKTNKSLFAIEIHKITKILFEKSMEHLRKYSSTDNAFSENRNRVKGHLIPTVQYCFNLMNEEITESEIQSLPEGNRESVRTMKDSNREFKISLLKDGLSYCSVMSLDRKDMIEAYEKDGIENPFVFFSDALKKLEPTYEPNVKKSGCYIATAVYGDYDATEVVVLRNYRDKYLLETDIGKLVIKGYYKYSPLFAVRLRNNKFLSSAVRKILDVFVCKLKKM